MKIVVVGCGPKALAIYAKRCGLKAAGFQVPEITVIEQFDVAANWKGVWQDDEDKVVGYGFTDGDHPLGTPPEKDIGYPYDSEYKDYGASDIDSYLFQYSWQSFKIDQGAYADWMDRGRPAPHHREWARYLAWAGDKLGLRDSVTNPEGYINGVVEKVTKRENRWVVEYARQDVSDDKKEEIVCDALVFTGPGEPKDIDGQTLRIGRELVRRPTVLDGRSFWEGHNIRYLQSWSAHKTKIAVIGAGETAAAVICALIKLDTKENWQIDVISRRGTLYTRGEGYHENRYFSNPGDWAKLPQSLREELIERTDRGVLSVQAVQMIAKASTVNCRHGEVASIRWNNQKPILNFKKELPGSTPKNPQFTLEPETYDFVVVAMGFNPLSIRDYFSDKSDLEPLLAAARVETGDEKKETEDKKKEMLRCAERIGEDLSVTGLEPKLYLPMLSGLMQGPGFPNLSCLGRLSDRILRHSLARLNPGRIKK
jgi:mycobactin lysine-N-oxygenase